MYFLAQCWIEVIVRKCCDRQSKHSLLVLFYFQANYYVIPKVQIAVVYLTDSPSRLKLKIKFLAPMDTKSKNSPLFQNSAALFHATASVNVSPSSTNIHKT